MGLFRKKKKNIGKYVESDYEKAIRSLDAEEDNDFFSRKSFTENASSVMAIIKAIVYIAFIIVTSCFLAYFAISFVNDVFAFVKENREVEVTIPEYVTSDELADILSEAKVIKHPGVFRLYAKLKHIDQKEESYKFVAGTYTVNENMNYDELFLSFVESTEITTFRLTIPEGYCVDDIINLFLSKGVGTREGWIDAVNNYDFGEDFSFIYDIPENEDRIYRLEGYLFPDTYDFYTGMPEYYYLRRLLVRFDEIFNKDLRNACTEAGHTMDEVLMVASIIQKEAFFTNDYELVSQVVWNRLAEGSPYKYLELESTVIYPIFHYTGRKITEVTSSDLQYDSPYNSFKYSGAVPGPICNPSYTAIITAVYPGESTKKYYFFVTDADNNLLVASTASEHQKNVDAVKKELEKRKGQD